MVSRGLKRGREPSRVAGEGNESCHALTRLRQVPAERPPSGCRSLQVGFSENAERLQMHLRGRYGCFFGGSRVALLESYSTLATRVWNEQKRSRLGHTGHNRSQGAVVESFGHIC